MAPGTASRPESSDSGAGHRPARRGYFALLASLFLVDLGSAMVAIALPLLLVRDYGVSFAVGLTFAVGVLPRVLAAPFLGSLLVRHDPRRIAMISALLSAPLTALIPLTDQMWQFQALNLAISLVGAVVEPSRMALRASTVAEGDEFRGTGLFVAAERVPRVLGPGLVGALAAIGLGAASVFLVPTVCAVAAGLLVMRVPAVKRPGPGAGKGQGVMATVAGNAKALVAAAARDRFVAGLTLTAFPYVIATSIARIMLLTMTQTRYAADKGIFGLLLGGLSLGAVVGALLCGRLRGIDYGTLYVLGNVLEAGVWLGLTAVHNHYVAVAAVFLAGILEAAPTVVFIAENQRRLSPELLGYYYAALYPLIDTAATIGYLIGGVLIRHGVTVSGWCTALLIAVPVLATVRWYRGPAPIASLSGRTPASRRSRGVVKTRHRRPPIHPDAPVKVGKGCNFTAASDDRR
jgi:MFS family permease